MKIFNKILICASTVSACIAASMPFSAQARNLVPSEAMLYQDHYYMIYDDLQDMDNFSWEAAQRLCVARGGHLAIIESKEESDWLYDAVINSGYQSAFFGLYLEDDEWKWVNGKTAEYFDWSKNQPKGGCQYGMYSKTHKKGKWFDGNYQKDGTAYICEWDSGEIYNAAVEYDEDLLPVLPSNMIDFGDSKCKIYNYPLTFEQASEFCNLMGGHLVFIDSYEKQELIMQRLEKTGRKNMYWTGAAQRDRWCWNDNEVSADMVYSNWAAGEPSNSDGDSVHAAINLKSPNFDKGSWVAESNIGAEYREEEYYANYGFICEWEYNCISEEGEFIFHQPSFWKVYKVQTCTQGGLKNYKCKRCNATVSSRPTDSLGHDNEAIYLFDTFRFNPIPGIEKYNCRRCNEINYEFNLKGFIIDIAAIILVAVILSAYFSAKKEYYKYHI